MNFSKALKQLKTGACMRRGAWPSCNSWIGIFEPTDLSDMTQSYLYILDEDMRSSGLTPWSASSADLLATDWEFYE